MYAEVEQYIATAEAVRSTYSEQYRAARNKYNAREIGYDEMRTSQDAEQRIWQVATNEAWNALKACSDPLVSWIVDNCKDHQSQATAVLEALPATVEELDRLAEDENWCQIWDNFRARAAEDGAIVLPQLSTAREALIRWAQFSEELDRSEVAELLRLVDAVVAEEGASK